MKYFIQSTIVIILYVLVLGYILNVIQSLYRLIKQSISDKALCKSRLKMLLATIFLGQYGIYSVEETRYLRNETRDNDFPINKRTQRTYFAISLLTVLGIAMIILPRIGYGNEAYGSIFENNNYTAYHYATITEIDENGIPVDLEIFGIAAVEKYDDSRRIKNIHVKGMGTLHGYSDEDLEVFEAPISYFDISDNHYKVKILSLKPELIVKERFNAKVEATIFHKEGRDRQKVINEVRLGNKLVYLARDYSNENNHNPVLVYSSYGYLGHLRSDLSAQISKILDAGGVVQAEVIEITPQGNSETYLECNLEIKIMAIDEKENYIYQPVERN